MDFFYYLLWPLQVACLLEQEYSFYDLFNFFVLSKSKYYRIMSVSSINEDVVKSFKY